MGIRTEYPKLDATLDHVNFVQVTKSDEASDGNPKYSSKVVDTGGMKLLPAPGETSSEKSTMGKRRHLSEGENPDSNSNHGFQVDDDEQSRKKKRKMIFTRIGNRLRQCAACSNVATHSCMKCDLPICSQECARITIAEHDAVHDLRSCDKE
jgi:hypothetical protein